MFEVRTGTRPRDGFRSKVRTVTNENELVCSMMRTGTKKRAGLFYSENSDQLK